MISEGVEPKDVDTPPRNEMTYLANKQLIKTQINEAPFYFAVF